MATTVTIDADLQRSIDALNALLRGELSAVETYEQAIASFAADVPPTLRDCLRSHQMRVEKLTMRIYDLGGRPSEGSGAWGAFARLVEGGAAMFGRKAALNALEEGEDHGLAEYRERIDDLDPESHRLVMAELFPEQKRSHDALRDLLRVTI